MQVLPLPVYPVLQPHVKDPGVLVHSALSLQSSVLDEHSLISAKILDNSEIYVPFIITSACFAITIVSLVALASKRTWSV